MMLEHVDYYRAKTPIKTPAGIIPQGSIGHMSQYGDVIRFEGFSEDGNEIVVSAIADKVKENNELFEAITELHGR